MNKIYVLMCICFGTKAMHLDFVSDLTTQAFIASLKRFFGRRGNCQIIGANIESFIRTSLIGANIELQKLWKLTGSPDEQLSNILAQEGIELEFILPKLPNFGDIGEAGVKSFKLHRKRVVGDQKLTLEEFLTILSKIEGALNSRPFNPCHRKLIILRL